MTFQVVNATGNNPDINKRLADLDVNQTKLPDCTVENSDDLIKPITNKTISQLTDLQ